MDPITPLAAQLVTLLAPVLPQLVSGARTVAEDIAGQLQTDHAELIGRIWDRLRPKTEAKPAAAIVLETCRRVTVTIASSPLSSAQRYYARTVLFFDQPVS